MFPVIDGALVQLSILIKGLALTMKHLSYTDGATAAPSMYFTVARLGMAAKFALVTKRFKVKAQELGDSNSKPPNVL